MTSYGITHENIVLEKIICGDASDNIKGIKGMGETTLLKLFPSLKNEKSSIDEVLEMTNTLLDERKQEKKKPLKALTNLIDRVTDGIQGKDIYEINKKIIDLSEPLLSEEAREELSESINNPIDTDDRSLSNVYHILQANDMSEMMQETRFTNLFGRFSRIMEMERKKFKKS